MINAICGKVVETETPNAIPEMFKVQLWHKTTKWILYSATFATEESARDWVANQCVGFTHYRLVRIPPGEYISCK